jgi:iron(III) transport system substrate-binding protein
MPRQNIGRRTFLGWTAGAAAAASLPTLSRAQANGVVNLYSSRHYDTDERLYADFTAATGIKVNRVEAQPDALLERMKAEGANSPADVFISVDSGRLQRARDMGLLQPLSSQVIKGAVPSNLRDPDDHWFGFSTRARVIMYNRDRVQSGEIATYEDLADPRWKGRLLSRSSSHTYTQSLVGSILAARGEAATEAWCRGVVANFARPPKGGDTDQIRGVVAGEGDLCIANTYYLGNIIRKAAVQDAELVRKIGVLFPNQADRGTHVNIAGGGIAASAKNRDNAIKFLEYLVTPGAQTYFAEGNDEFPVIAGAALPKSMAGLGGFKVDALNAGVFARNAGDALKIMDRAGWK